MRLIKQTRRMLLKEGASLAAISSLGLPAAALAKGGRAPAQKFDVVVVGSGAGGCTSAIRAAEAGARVALVEVMSWVGGSSRIASGIFGCAGHPIQKALGITTTPEDLYRLYISEAAATKTKGDPAASRILADGAIPAADWLISIGVEFRRDKAQKFFLNSKAGHRFGELLIGALEKKARDLGVQILTNTRGKKILMSHGRVAGLACSTPSGNLTLRAPAVILAAGGFEASAAMIKKYVGHDWDKAGFYTTPGNRGDGQRMGEAAGAALADMEVFKGNPFVHNSKGFLYSVTNVVRGGGIAVNANGERFCKETGGYYQSWNVWKQPGRHGWLIFGQPLVDADKKLQRIVARGSVFCAQDPASLARLAGIKPEGLKAGLEHYRSLLASGKDPEFGRGAMKDVFAGKLYAMPFEPRVQGTFGGVKTNTETQALTAAGAVVPGLYAVGECASVGLRGLNPQTANIVFGSIAGRNAAAYARKAK